METVARGRGDRAGSRSAADDVDVAEERAAMETAGSVIAPARECSILRDERRRKRAASKALRIGPKKERGADRANDAGKVRGRRVERAYSSFLDGLAAVEFCGGLACGGTLPQLPGGS
jgi:hypothetical protein